MASTALRREHALTRTTTRARGEENSSSISGASTYCSSLYVRWWDSTRSGRWPPGRSHPFPGSSSWACSFHPVRAAHRRAWFRFSARGRSIRLDPSLVWPIVGAVTSLLYWVSNPDLGGWRTLHYGHGGFQHLLHQHSNRPRGREVPLRAGLHLVHSGGCDRALSRKGNGSRPSARGPASLSLASSPSRLCSTASSTVCMGLASAISASPMPPSSRLRRSSSSITWASSCPALRARK